MQTCGILATAYSISVGRGVRLFLSCCVSPERSVEVTKPAPHLCFLDNFKVPSRGPMGIDRWNGRPDIDFTLMRNLDGSLRLGVCESNEV